METKRHKDPEYKILNTGRWIISPDAQRVIDKLDKKRKRKEAWLKKQKALQKEKENAERKNSGRGR